MVVAATNKEPTTVDFVLVIEATANMVTHWETLKKSYVFPAISYFNGRPPSGKDYTGNHGSSQFSYVLFHSADQNPEPMTKCSRPMNSPWNFVRALDNLTFNGGGSERFSLVAEGLAKALQLFDDLALRRGPGNNARKVCFLICNSPPYDLPCYESLSYPGFSAEKLAELMGSKGINLSVICPQQIKPLQQLYLSANQNKPPAMNYAQDPRHLVFISGFPLPTERDPVKLSQQNNEQKQILNNNITAGVVSSSVPSPAQHPSPAAAQAYTSHNTPNSSSLSPGNLQQQTANSVSQVLAGLNDPIISVPIPSQAIGGSATTNQTAPTTQGVNVQVTGPTAINISSQANMLQTSQQNIQSQLPLSNQQQMLDNFPSMSNSVGGIQLSGTTSSLLTSFTNSNTILAPSSGNNTNIKDLLRPTQSQILPHSTGPGTTGQGLFTNSQTGMQAGGMKDQQRMTPLSIGTGMSMPTSLVTASGGNMQMTPFSNSSGINSVQNNTVASYNNQNQQQINQTNQVVNQVDARSNMLQNFSSPSGSGVMDMPSLSVQPINNQMQNQVQMQNQQQRIGQQQQQQQQQQTNILNNIGMAPQQSSTGFMSGQQNQNNISTATTSYQLARQVAESVMKQAQMSTVSNANNNTRFTNPIQGMSGQAFPGQQTQPNQPQQMIQSDTMRMVWSGTVEWTEKRKISPAANPARTTHMLNCQVFLQPTQSDDGVNANTWPSKLTMQLIPHIVFSTMQNQVKNNRSVTLRMSPPDHVQALANIMKNKWMGLIQIPPQNQNPVENKVMLVIYSQKKSQFFGLLPVDPHSFITTIRKVIAKHQPRFSNPNQAQQSSMGQNNLIQQFQQQQQQQQNQTDQQIPFQLNNTIQQQQQHNQMNQRQNVPMTMVRPISNQMGQGVPVQSNVQGQSGMTNQQRIMDMNFRQTSQRMPNQGQMSNAMMAQQPQQQQPQQIQQQSNMVQPQMQQAGNPNQQRYMYQQRNIAAAKPGMGQVEQNTDLLRQQQLQRLQMAQQQQQQQQPQQVQQRNNMSMNQISGSHGNMGDEQLRNLLQSGSNNMGQTMNTQQRPRIQMINTAMRQGPQSGLRPGFMQNQVRRPTMPGNRMMGMQQQQQQQRFGNMQQNQQQPPMM